MWVWESTRPGRTVLPRRSMSLGLLVMRESSSLRVVRLTISPVEGLTSMEIFLTKDFCLGSKRRDVCI